MKRGHVFSGGSVQHDRNRINPKTHYCMIWLDLRLIYRTLTLFLCFSSFSAKLWKNIFKERKKVIKTWKVSISSVYFKFDFYQVELIKLDIVLCTTSDLTHKNRKNKKYRVIKMWKIFISIVIIEKKSKKIALNLAIIR